MHYSSAPVVGGVESVMREHSLLFTRAGYPVTIFSGRGEQVDEQVSFQKIKLFNSSAARILAIREELDKGIIPPEFDQAVSDILRILEIVLNPFDVVIAHNICSLHKNLPLTAALQTYILENRSMKLISWDHDLAWTNDQYRSQLIDAYPWKLLKETWHPTRHQHVTVSQMRKNEMVNLLGDDAPDVTAIPSGIDWHALLRLDAQALDIIQTYDLMHAYPVLFLPARITRRKNLEIAISITAALKAFYPSIALLISGPLGPHNPKNRIYFDELKTLTDQYKLNQPKEKGQEKVIFLADYDNRFLPMDTIYDLFRFTDALLFPSFQEGFGIPILEAGMVGMPIFCSEIAPFHETANSNAHFFNPEGNPEAIAREIHQIIEGDKTLNHKHRVKQQYTWNNIFKNQIEPLVSKLETKE